MHILKRVIVYFLAVSVKLVGAQELPPIQVFTPQMYGGENQNWAISQSADRHIYVANNLGLLEYNGASWKLYNSPNETLIRSVAVYGDRIYTGCYMEFGYWKRDNLGLLNYTSLSQTLKVKMLEDEHFWNIIPLDEGVVFQSLNRIYLFNTVSNDIKVITSENVITKMSLVNDTIMFQKINDGIYIIEHGKAKLLTSSPIIKDEPIVNIFTFNGDLLIQTVSKGFYLFSNNSLEKWNIKANEILSKVNVYSSLKLDDDSFVLGTISEGLIHLNKDGSIKETINQVNGLTNNTVLSLFEDIDDNIWLGLDNGINCININSPIRVYNNQKGNLGTIYASQLHNGYLYLGTNQGLFYKEARTQEDFRFMEGTKGQVWNLIVYDNTLFCGHTDGTIIINGNQASKIPNSPSGTWDIKPIPGRPNVLLQGNYEGLNTLHKVNGSWVFKNSIEGFINSSKFFEIGEDNTVYVSHEYKGVYNLKMNDDFSKVESVQSMPEVSKGLHASLIKYNSDILYTNKNGIYKYNSVSGKFVKDSILSSIIPESEYETGKLVVDQENNRLWAFTEGSMNYVEPGKLSETPEIHKISIPSALRKGMSGYENISHVENDTYLFGMSNGYLFIELDKLPDQKTYNVKINAIKKGKHGIASEHISQDGIGEFTYSENNLELAFSVPNYSKFSEVKYSHQLEGIYDNWSDWSTKSTAVYENLPFGDYTFNLRAKVGNKTLVNEASYEFRINRPWYLSNLMITVYLLGLFLFSLLMHNLYRRYYRKQQEKLLEKSKREIEIKQLENEQQQMLFENEALSSDIESKNRELAISTMSLIKKNEFLNSLKKELNVIESNQKLNTVIKIIDKNLNNTDDWKFFEEAFNNADKEFLKKMKSAHPGLTSNDLRLCAYLRLNLSSKEIAPLLNISPRSVEVKRYRLRKKMDLSRETSLTNYILEI